jgi:hypothetical protein
MINADALQRAREEREQREQARLQAVQNAWNAIPGVCSAALGDAPRDWIALECLANEQAYAKPDTEKCFVLWEATQNGAIEVVEAENLGNDHPWLRALFLPPNGVVRFPFNTGDSGARDSISWDSIARNLRPAQPRFWELPRWSTASRSSVGLVPQLIGSLTQLQAWPRPPARSQLQVNDPDIALNLQEWQDLGTPGARPGEAGLFYNAVTNLGAAANAGMTRANAQYRLYSIKTGVNYVGSKFEGGDHGKHKLEANCNMAMLRSEVIRALPNRDSSFGLQLELLTVIAPLGNGERDGFQVRDLSCLREGLSYIPGQAVPYGRRYIDRLAEHGGQCEFWRENFAVPLGRAKARLFLNYGLIHTSANAQNFVLGFRGNRLEQFVIRDLGDTSWHDDYIHRYLRILERGRRVNQAFVQESGAGVRHVLHNTSSGQYPPPHIVRLAAYSLLTHRFGDGLGWSRRQQYRFITGIFDGFLSYLREALESQLGYPDDVAGNALGLNEALEIGRVAGYPPGIGADGLAYRNKINELRQSTTAQLLERARWIRQHGESNINSDDRLRQLIGAEEALLCSAVERHLMEDVWDAELVRVMGRLRDVFASVSHRTAWPRIVP